MTLGSICADKKLVSIYTHPLYQTACHNIVGLPQLAVSQIELSCDLNIEAQNAWEFLGEQFLKWTRSQAIFRNS